MVAAQAETCWHPRHHGNVLSIQSPGQRSTCMSAQPHAGICNLYGMSPCAARPLTSSASPRLFKVAKVAHPCLGPLDHFGPHRLRGRLVGAAWP